MEDGRGVIIALIIFLALLIAGLATWNYLSNKHYDDMRAAGCFKILDNQSFNKSIFKYVGDDMICPK